MMGRAASLCPPLKDTACVPSAGAAGIPKGPVPLALSGQDRPAAQAMKYIPEEVIVYHYSELLPSHLDC